MTVRVDWDDPDHSILLYSFSPKWTWDELYEAADKGLVMADTVSHTVDVIVDFRTSQGLPPKAFAQFNRLSRMPTPQTGLVVITGGGTLLLSLFNLFILIAGSSAPKYCWVSDLNKAYSTLAARRTASPT